MKISILCSDNLHPVYSYLENWKEKYDGDHEISLVTDKRALIGGEILFLISCHDIINELERKRYKKTLVIHASDLPIGRGWSPHVWQILEGKNEIVVSLLEAAKDVDSGAIWFKRRISICDHELADDINTKIFNAEIELMDMALVNFEKVIPQHQDNSTATYYPKRKPEDSRIDPDKTIAEQFDLLRISDARRYPAFFEYRGYRYKLNIEKVGETTLKDGD